MRLLFSRRAAVLAAGRRLRRPGPCPGAGAGRLPRQAGPVHRPLPARRRHRRHRPHRAGEVPADARPADRHREPRRRRRLARQRPRGEVAARRLHRPLHAQLAHHQPGDLPEAAVQHGQGLRADRHGRVAAADPGRQPAVPGQQRGRADGAGEGQAGHAVVRVGRQRLARAIWPASSTSCAPARS